MWHILTSWGSVRFSRTPIHGVISMAQTLKPVKALWYLYCTPPSLHFNMLKHNAFYGAIQIRVSMCCRVANPCFVSLQGKVSFSSPRSPYQRWGPHSLLFSRYRVSYLGVNRPRLWCPTFHLSLAPTLISDAVLILLPLYAYITPSSEVTNFILRCC
jgi:hypothetical protein